MMMTIAAFGPSPDGGEGLVSFAALKEPAQVALHPFGRIPTYEGRRSGAARDRGDRAAYRATVCGAVAGGGERAWAGELGEFCERLKTMTQDVASLSDHASYVLAVNAFLLGAALGLVNVEQTTIVKIISIMSVIFLPLTLIASSYGMNFEHMPFLHSPEGFWATCGIMVMIIVGLLWLSKVRRWI